MPYEVIVSPLLALNYHLSVKQHKPTEHQQTKVQLDLLLYVKGGHIIHAMYKTVIMT